MILTCSITRALLGLGDLNLNDGVAYKVVSITPGEQTWNRQRVRSPYVDGEVTTQRTRNSPPMEIMLEVRGDTQVEVQTNMATVVEAFSQDTFVLSFGLDDQDFSVYGEAADRRNEFQKERVHARMQQVTFAFPRRPVPAIGVL